MLTKENRKQILTEITPALERGFLAIMLEVLEEHYPDTNFSDVPSLGLMVTIDEYVTQSLKYYAGEGPKPTAMSISKADAVRESMESEGTYWKQWVIPPVIEEWIQRISIPGVLQKYLGTLKIQISA